MPQVKRRSYWIVQSIKDELFDSKYTLGSEIGRGRSSFVYKCVRKGLNQPWAVKIIQKNLDKKVNLADIGTVLGLNHENLVRLQEIFETKNRIFIVEELAQGGTLLDRIAELEVYSEHIAAKAIRDVISGINYLHNCGYVVRNLKPENLLYATDGPDSRLQIADFAMCSLLSLEVDMSAVCGAPAYTAPEVLKGDRYGKPVDIWSVGVILYLILCGYEPFQNDNPSQLFKLILKGKLSFPEEDWQTISLNGRDFIRKLLVIDPRNRISAATALRSMWVQGSVPKNAHLDDVVDRLRIFNEQRKQKVITEQLDMNTIHPNKNPRFLLYYRPDF